MTNVWQKESKLYDQNFSLATASKERSLGPWTLCPVILAACPTFRDHEAGLFHAYAYWLIIPCSLLSVVLTGFSILAQVFFSQFFLALRFLFGFNDPLY